MHGHWTGLPEDFDESEWFGFIYEITNNLTGRKYIGKKQLHSYRRKKIKGRKNRKRVVKDSDWRTYTGSCQELNEDIESLGKEKFSFVVLQLCKTKGELTYAEVECQVKRNVLTETMESGDRLYYNGNILNRFFPRSISDLSRSTDHTQQ